MARIIDGSSVLAYRGVKPVTPPNMVIPGIRPTSQPRDPTQNDIQYNLGDFWLNTNTKGLWYLAALGSHLVSGVNTRFATWLQFSTGQDELQSLTGDTGGPVFGDANQNINVIADNAGNNAGSTVLIVGTPLNNTLTLNVSDGSNNTLVGRTAGNLTLTGANNTALGVTALDALTTGSFNTALGSGGSLGALTTGTTNTAIGYGTLDEITTGSSNLALGAGAGGSLTTGDSNNTLINYAGIAGESGKYFFQIPGGDLFFHNAGTDNTFVGAGTGNITLTGNSNVAVGVFGTTLVDITTGNLNNAFGRGALSDLTTGSQNNAFGNTLNHLTTGSQNTAIGYFAGDGTTTGSNNIFIGDSSGFSANGASNSNIYIHNQGGPVEDNVMRIGENGSAQLALSKVFIDGIRGVTTDVNDAIAVLIDSAGQLGTVSSSIRYKENVEDLGLYSNDLYRLRPVRFNYKQHPSIAKSIGLIAEEVMEVYPDLVVKDSHGCPETVKYQDLPVLLLNELQRHQQVIEHLLNRIEDLERALG